MPLLGLVSRDAYLRAGDADRERVADELTRHCAAGRLTTDELSERVEATYRARTLGELAAVTRDLPRLPARAARPPARPRWRKVAVLAAVVTLALATAAGAGLVTLLAQDPLAGVLVLVALFACLVLLTAALGSLLAAAAPVVALALAARWIGRRFGALESATPRVRLKG